MKNSILDNELLKVNTQLSECKQLLNSLHIKDKKVVIIEKNIKIKNPVALTSNLMLKLIIKSIDNQLDIQDVVQEKVIKIIKHNRISYFFISKFTNDQFIVQFMINNVFFERNYYFKTLNNKKESRIFYQERILLARTHFNSLKNAKKLKKIYIKMQINHFKALIFQLKYYLLLLSKNKMLKYESTFLKYQSNILKYQSLITEA